MARERPLIEQPIVTIEVDKAHATYSRFHDLYDGLTWRLCRDPAPDEAVEIAPSMYVVRSHKYDHPGFCQIVMIYTVNGEEEIVIEDIKVTP